MVTISKQIRIEGAGARLRFSWMLPFEVRQLCSIQIIADLPATTLTKLTLVGFPIWQVGRLSLRLSQKEDIFFSAGVKVPAELSSFGEKPLAFGYENSRPTIGVNRGENTHPLSICPASRALESYFVDALHQQLKSGETYLLTLYLSYST